MSIEEFRRLAGLPAMESTENQERSRIVAALKAGYEKNWLDGLKMAAYKLEAEGASKRMLSSILRDIARTQQLDGKKLQATGKHDFVTMVMYANDLHQGAI